MNSKNYVDGQNLICQQKIFVPKTLCEPKRSEKSFLPELLDICFPVVMAAGEYSFIVVWVGWVGDRQWKKQKVGWRKTRDNQKNNQIKEGVVWLHAIILTSYGPHNYKEVVFESFENISPPLVHRCDEGFRDRNSSQRFDLSSLMAGLNISVPSSPL